MPYFGIDSVLKRPDGDLPGPWTVRPGAHGFGSGDSAYSVCWWDPRTLELDRAPSFGVRQQELLEKGNEDAVDRKLREHKRWQEEREQFLDDGARPSLRLQTATERARSGLKLDDGTTNVDVIEISAGTRPAGPRFGTLVHAVLAAVPLDAPPEEIRKAIVLQGRIFAATEQEIDAALSTVTNALDHPLMQRARKAAASGQCYREMPVVLQDAEGSLIEGVADLVFREDQQWVVIDFKTDQELLASELDRYQLQVEIYAITLAKATGTNTLAYLLRV